MFRVACALAIASQLVLLALFVQPTGATAIAFSFAGTPLLGTAMVLGLVWWIRRRGRRGDATKRTGVGAGDGDRGAD
jgi:uncharacterized membrane protein